MRSKKTILNAKSKSPALTSQGTPEDNRHTDKKEQHSNGLERHERTRHLKKYYIIFNIFFSLSSYRPVVICIALSLPLLSFIPLLKSCAKFPKGSSLS